jgi:hypothetical protein
MVSPDAHWSPRVDGLVSTRRGDAPSDGVEGVRVWWLSNAKAGVWTTAHVMRRLGRGLRRPSCGNGGKILSRKDSLDDVGSSSPRGGWIDGSPAVKLVFRVNAMIVHGCMAAAAPTLVENIRGQPVVLPRNKQNGGCTIQGKDVCHRQTCGVPNVDRKLKNRCCGSRVDFPYMPRDQDGRGGNCEVMEDGSRATVKFREWRGRTVGQVQQTGSLPWLPRPPLHPSCGRSCGPCQWKGACPCQFLTCCIHLQPRSPHTQRGKR